MSVSAVAPTPFYHDPERLQIGLPQAATAEDAPAATEDGKHLSMFAEKDEPSFWDVLDVINPLQHIPVISNLYREMTGDQIGVGARLVGGTLFGGALGLIASAVDCVIEEGTGKDTGGHVLALFRDEGDSAPTTQLAAAEPKAEPAAPPPAPQAEETAVPGTDLMPAMAPAKVTKSAAEAPAIALPLTGSGAMPGAQPLVFSLNDGLQASAPATPTAAAAPVPVTPAAARPADPAALQALADPKAARTRPVPARNITPNAPPLTPITVPVSSTGMRSNTPITGRAPAVSMPVQRNTTPAPMPLPDTAEQTGAQTAAGGDWFSAAWGQALDKYQRANQRNEKASGGAATAGELN